MLDSFFKNVPGLPGNFTKKCFFVNIAKFLRTAFSVYRVLGQTSLVAASKHINGNSNVRVFDHINKFMNVFLRISEKKIVQKGFSSLGKLQFDIV